MENDIPKLEDFLDDHSLQEVIGLAVRSELEAQKRYELLAQRVNDDDLQEIFTSLVEEEKRHEKQFRENFSDFFPEKELKLPDESVKPSPDFEMEAKEQLTTVMKKAMQSEKESEQFYSELASTLGDEESRRMVAYFASVERDHYEAIRSELNKMEEGTGPG